MRTIGSSSTDPANPAETDDGLHHQVQLLQQQVADLQERLSEKDRQSRHSGRVQAEMTYFREFAINRQRLLDTFLRSFAGRLARFAGTLGAIVKNWSAKVGWIEYRKPHQNGRLPFDLRPVNEVEQLPHLPGQWRSSGNDPWFVVLPHRTRKRSGWYMIELMVTSTVPEALAKFYFDYGDGFAEDRTVGLMIRSGQMAKRIYRLESTPRQIRLDPLESSGLFRVDHLNFVRIPEWFAADRMADKLRRVKPELHNLSNRDIKELYKQKNNLNPVRYIERLYADYAKTFVQHQQPVSYDRWIETIEKPLYAGRKRIEIDIHKLRYKPLISIVMPVYNTDPPLLRKAIESVLNQSYPHWELCIADDASTKTAVRSILESYRQKDRRVKVVFRETNGHICEASNTALDIAEGSYIALLDHDDELAEHALYFVVRELNQKPDARILYSDEDKIDENGHRFEPNFKSDWNPDQLLSQNYISHLGVYQAELVKQVGGFRKGYEGSQDYDLLLRCIAQVDHQAIVHIPLVLYHWRAVKGSTALSDGEKAYTTAAGVRALRDYFSSNPDVDVIAGLSPNTFRVVYPVPNHNPLVTLIIPTRNQFDYLSRCISSILSKTTYANYEIVVIDNQSTGQRTLNYLNSIQKKENIRVIEYDRPFNFSAINNYGVAQAKGAIVGLINNDIEVISPGWLTEMVAHACRKEIGCVGAKLFYTSGMIQHAGVILGIGGVAGHSHKYFPNKSSGYFSRLLLTQNYSAVTGACLIVRKSVYEEVGGLNEIDLPVAFNDVDFCLKVQKAGYRNLWTPFAELYHHESVSRGAEDSQEKQQRFAKEIAYMKHRWGDALTSDRYYNPHLSMVREDFSLRIAYPADNA